MSDKNDKTTVITTSPAELTGTHAPSSTDLLHGIKLDTQAEVMKLLLGTSIQCNPVVKMKKVREGAPDLPAYATPEAAGMDVRADLSGFLDEEIMRNGLYLPGRVCYTYKVPCGFAMELPPGYEAQVRSRSGLALNNQVVVMNAPGTVDSDYRGEMCVILTNLGLEPFRVYHGDRIAQMVIARVERAEVVQVPELSTTDRGASGFGSSGVK